jgi:hypothetical protein
MKNKKGSSKSLKPFTVLGDPDWIQTNDLLLRRQLLYSAELPDRLPKYRQGRKYN